MKVLISGSRHLTEPQLVERILTDLFKEHPGGILIHGGAKGVDSFAGKLATKHGYIVIVCPAEWDKYGKSAGIIRNKSMIDDYAPDLLIAFPIPESKGTYHAIAYAKKKNIPTQIYHMSSQVVNSQS